MMTTAENALPTFTAYRAVIAEGSRIGLLTCLACGAACVIDPDDERDGPTIHAQWHRDQAPAHPVGLQEEK